LIIDLSSLLLLQAATTPNFTGKRGSLCLSKEYLPVAQIAKELGLSEETLLRWIRNKELKAYRLGKTYRVTKADYQEFLDQSYTGKADEDQRN
jgi:excisionase family DNA binding protein